MNNQIPLWIGFILFLPQVLFSQQKLQTSTTCAIGKSHIGIGFHLSQEIRLNRHQWTAGFKLNLKSNPVDDTKRVLWNRGYPQSLPEMLGLEFSYAFAFAQLNSRFRLSAFTNAEVVRTSLKRSRYEFEAFVIYPHTGTLMPVYSLRTSTTSPITIWEQTIGLQIKYEISQYLLLFQRAGSGVAIANTDAFSSNGTKRSYAEAILPYFQFGFTYQWNAL